MKLFNRSYRIAKSYAVVTKSGMFLTSVNGCISDWKDDKKEALLGTKRQMKIAFNKCGGRFTGDLLVVKM